VDLWKEALIKNSRNSRNYRGSASLRKKKRRSKESLEEGKIKPKAQTALPLKGAKTKRILKGDRLLGKGTEVGLKPKTVGELGLGSL